MAYVEQHNFLAYFVPHLGVAVADPAVMRTVDIGASSSSAGEYICVKPCMVHRGQFTATEEAVSGTSVAPTVVLSKRPTPLSASGASVVMTLTVPSGMAIGKTCYKDVKPVQFNVGDSLEIAWTVGTGTPTGIGVVSVLCENSPKTPDENSEMVASA